MAGSGPHAPQRTADRQTASGTSIERAFYITESRLRVHGVKQ
jgi:hypothetical protein